MCIGETPMCQCLSLLQSPFIAGFNSRKRTKNFGSYSGLWSTVKLGGQDALVKEKKMALVLNKCRLKVNAQLTWPMTKRLTDLKTNYVLASIR
jgi:hypothetical protein